MGTPIAAIIEPTRARRELGLDLLRLFAMVVVIAQHGLTVVGHYDWTMLTPSGVTVGQFGVAIFCALSGWFALSGNTAPGPWLFTRLAKLYPAYWIATVFAFGLALAMGRSVTLWLFVSQMAGTGFFTHGWALVNVVSWFISLIVLCYLLAAIARLSKRKVWAMAAFGAIAILVLALRLEIPLSRHVIVFAVAAVAGGSNRPKLLLGVALALVPFIFLQPSFVYAIVALPVLWLFQHRIAIVSALVTKLADHTYEFFLLHGIFLAGAATITHSVPLAIAIGVGGAVPAAVLLKHAVARIGVLGRGLTVNENQATSR